MKGNKYAHGKGSVRPGKTGKDTAGIGKTSAGPKIPQVSRKQERKAKQHSKKKRQSETMSDGEEDVPPMPAVGDSGQPWDFRQAVVVESGSKSGSIKKQRKEDKRVKAEKSKEATVASPSAAAMMTCPGEAFSNRTKDVCARSPPDHKRLLLQVGMHSGASRLPMTNFSARCVGTTSISRRAPYSLAAENVTGMPARYTHMRTSRNANSSRSCR